MSKAESASSGRTYTIVDTPAETGRLTVREPTTGEVYEVVDYGDESIEGFAETFTPDSTVRLELTPAGEGEGTREMTSILPTTVHRSFGSE
jgi:hypothetical protein